VHEDEAAATAAVEVERRLQEVLEVAQARVVELGVATAKRARNGAGHPPSLNAGVPGSSLVAR
jgi:hypothetical protein